jgi:hypothetical protein
MANFAVRLVHGPGWDSSRQVRDQDGWDEHAAFMDRLVDIGFIILGGPVGDGEQTLHVVQAADENEIRVRLAGDPWASAALLRIGTIERWALWLDSRPRNPARRSTRQIHAPSQRCVHNADSALSEVDRPGSHPGVPALYRAFDLVLRG